MTSMWGALGKPASASRAELYCRTEDIRSSMLDSLQQGDTTRIPNLQGRIENARDIQALWFMRSDWMSALSAVQGETAARDHLLALNARFEGLLPDGMQSRPSSLSRH